MVYYEDLMVAYRDCRRNKRSSGPALEYELNYEHSLKVLCDRINSRTYEPRTSVCFVVLKPCRREVFAASFEDRIVHHWIALRMEPLFETDLFSDRSFNCRKGKGQLYGINTLRNDLERCSENYTKDCWVMKMDISGMFMSIDKALLAGKLDEFIIAHYKGEDIEDLRYLVRVTVMHSPEKNCELHSPKKFWKALPANKSLFTTPDGLGMPIGNLPSQHFANFMLDLLDKFVLNELEFVYYGRYVDDFYIIDSNKSKLLGSVPRIREFLLELGMKLHKDKFYIQHYSKGVMFTGFIVKPRRVYVRNRTVYNCKQAIERLNRASTEEEFEKSIASVNSYLGIMIHCSSFNIRRALLDKLSAKVLNRITLRRDLSSIAIRRQYDRHKRILSKVKAHRWR